MKFGQMRLPCLGVWSNRASPAARVYFDPLLLEQLCTKLIAGLDCLVPAHNYNDHNEFTRRNALLREVS